LAASLIVGRFCKFAGLDTSKYHICRRLEGFSGCSRGGADW
jgi:hypothetical protein